MPSSSYISSSRERRVTAIKKFVKKVLILFIPVIVYMAMFIAFEPYEYFGRRVDGRENITTSPLQAMRAAMRGDVKDLLLGDSRTAHFDTRYLDSVTGKNYFNLAFGGASMEESIELFYWADRYNDLDSVSIQISFYTINQKYNLNRIPDMEDYCTDPLRFMFTWDYHADTWKELYNRIRGIKDLAPMYTDEEREENFRVYALESIYPMTEGYGINYDMIEKLRDMAEYCEGKGIQLNVIMAPMDRSLWEYVVKPLDLYDEMDEYKRLISEFAVIYDMEYEEMDAYVTSDYADGFHMMGMQNGVDYTSPSFETDYPALADYLKGMYSFSSDHMRIWKNGKVIKE